MIVNDSNPDDPVTIQEAAFACLLAPFLNLSMRAALAIADDQNPPYLDERLGSVVRREWELCTTKQRFVEDARNIIRALQSGTPPAAGRIVTTGLGGSVIGKIEPSEGPDLLADLPAGARIVKAVHPGAHSAAWEIEFLDGERLLTWSQKLGPEARAFARAQSPVFLDCVRTGQTAYLLDLIPVPENYDPYAAEMTSRDAWTSEKETKAIARKATE